MKRKFLWLGLSFLLVAALVLTACPAPVVEEPVVEEPVVEVGVPQYGGTLTAVSSYMAAGDIGNPDIASGQHNPTRWLAPIQEKPFFGDCEKYGPRGTGEFSFRIPFSIPEEYWRGALVESWELSAEKIVWHVRPGIYWQGRDVMESRELIAEDMVADLLHFKRSPGGASWTTSIGDIYATGRYTLVLEFTEGLDIMVNYFVGHEDRAIYSPPEIEGSERVEDQVGTGPWMFEEYVIGSHMSYVRNPIYWDTTTINGVEYPLPFIDKLIHPIIPDAATQVAALRTGMVDIIYDVASEQWPGLAKTAPELLFASHAGWGDVIKFKCTEPPFDNRDVRRALMVGTDIEAFAEFQGVGPLPLVWYPAFTEIPAIYTPLEELPAESQVLFDYNPELAIEMLADAGYPDGLEIGFTCDTEPYSLDYASLLEDMWAKIGVKVNIDANDRVTWTRLKLEMTYTDTLGSDMGYVCAPITMLTEFETGHHFNVTGWSDERFDELWAKIKAEPDPDVRNPMVKEIMQLVINEVPQVPTSPRRAGWFWWPWLKNYYGERTLSDGEMSSVLAFAWIDQDLKADMGY